ncbi:hypothetical protein BC833DRAFT_652159 [Globomyces pollinis-pini]|nr:hypothetical protein BC833DRAFT_652159 [Globomyces pollinis-pini]
MLFILPILLSLVALVKATPMEKDIDISPDHVETQTCDVIGPVTACIWNKNVANTRLYLAYDNTGALWAKGSPISAYVKINQEFIVTKNFIGSTNQTIADNTYAFYVVGAFSDVQRCYHPTTHDPVDYSPDGFSRCSVNDLFPLIDGPAKAGIISWFYTPAPNAEKELIAQAGKKDWNVELAFFNDKGDWDSIGGSNYQIKL